MSLARWALLCIAEAARVFATAIGVVVVIVSTVIPSPGSTSRSPRR